MQIIHSPKQHSFSLGSDGFSSSTLLEYVLSYFEKGLYTEGTALLRLARERLSPHQLLLAGALDSVDKAMMDHTQAQQTLQAASKRFAESDAECQVQIAALKNLLLDMAEDARPASAPLSLSSNSPSDNEPLQLLPLLIVKAETHANYSRTSPEERHALPALYITCFGRFEVKRAGPFSAPLSLCNNVKGQTILRYLITQPRHRETVDMLMAALWPEEPPEDAEHKLRVAVSALRCSLNQNIVSEAGGGYILCKGQVYQLNPAVQLHSDVDDFLALYSEGQKSADGKVRAAYYERACELYSGPFLVEDIYAEWSYFRREELVKMYVLMCDKLAEYNLQLQCYEAAARWASSILRVDNCDEEAHRQLIRAYAAQGRRGEAIRQYQECARILSKELGVQPMPETQKLLDMLARGTANAGVEESSTPQQ